MPKLGDTVALATALSEGTVALFHIDDGGRVSKSPYCVQPEAMDRAWMHARAGYWCASDCRGTIVDGVFPRRAKKPEVCTPWEGSWAHELSLQTQRRN